MVALQPGHIIAIIVAILVVIVASIVIAVLFFSTDYREKVHIDGKTILITGASQGLGEAAAILLAEKGANIAIVARTESNLVDVIAELERKAKHGKRQKFTYFVTDVVEYANNKKLLDDVTKWNDGNPPDVVWACAGVSKPGLFVSTDTDVLRSQMEINYWSAAYLLQNTLRYWLKPVLEKEGAKITKKVKNGSRPPPRSSRHFIFTASTVAYWGVAGYSPYAPCKAALRSLCDSVRQEIFLYEGAAQAQEISDYQPVRLHLVTPGNILSPGYEAENSIKHPVTKKLEEQDVALQARDVAADVIASLEAGDYQITTNFLGLIMRCVALGGSRRNGTGFADTVLSLVGNIAALFVSSDMDNDVLKWGQTYGISKEIEEKR